MCSSIVVGFLLARSVENRTLLLVPSFFRNSITFFLICGRKVFSPVHVKALESTFCTIGATLTFSVDLGFVC